MKIGFHRGSSFVQVQLLRADVGFSELGAGFAEDSQVILGYQLIPAWQSASHRNPYPAESAESLGLLRSCFFEASLLLTA